MKIFALIILLIATTTLAMAQAYLTDWAHIPIVANTDGAYGTKWRTDLYLYNNNSEDIIATIYFNSTDGQFSTDEDIYIPARRNIKLSNILQETFSYQGAGSLFIDASHSLHPENPDKVSMGVFSRTYNQIVDGGTFGQDIPNQFYNMAIYNTYLYGITNNTYFRTNIGIATLYNTSGNFTAKLYNANGEQIDNYDIRVAPNSVTQISINSEVDNGTMEIVTPSENIIYVSYMTQIDNITGDAIYVPGAQNIHQ